MYVCYQVKFETPLRLPASSKAPPTHDTKHSDQSEGSGDVNSTQAHSVEANTDHQENLGVARDIVENLVEDLPLRNATG